jgi:hypothetical protein
MKKSVQVFLSTAAALVLLTVAWSLVGAAHVCPVKPCNCHVDFSRCISECKKLGVLQHEADTHCCKWSCARRLVEESK